MYDAMFHILVRDQDDRAASELKPGEYLEITFVEGGVVYADVRSHDSIVKAWARGKFPRG